MNLKKKESWKKQQRRIRFCVTNGKVGILLSQCAIKYKQHELWFINPFRLNCVKHSVVLKQVEVPVVFTKPINYISLDVHCAYYLVFAESIDTIGLPSAVWFTAIFVWFTYVLIGFD